jgi:autotransporter-associated beta strand protein
MEFRTLVFRRTYRLLWAAIPLFSAHLAGAMDMRFDVASNGYDGDSDWFESGQLVNLNFPSVNGHDIAQGDNSKVSTIQAEGNTLGVYYNNFDSLYSSTETPAAAVSTIQSWIKSNFGGYKTGAWLVLNEVNGSVWNNTSTGSSYRTWLVNTMSALHTAGYNNIILYAESSLASSTYASTWQGITQYADIGDECYIDGQVVEADNYSVSTLQAVYQASYNAWTDSSVPAGHSPTGAGISAASLILGEDFSINTYAASNYWGADGISGTAWQEAIEARDIAIHNIPFGGFIGYEWEKDGQATGNQTTDLAAQVSYERAYASTLVVQTEVPAWTGNDGTTSWNDYLNWTGGLPSTTSAPYPLLASTNPNLPLQTAANFLTAIQANTTITLDGNQSINALTFGNTHSYTIAPGTSGSLTFAGTNPTVTVTLGSHSITAGVVLSANLSANLTGNLTLSGSLTDSGYALTKSGTGTLTLSGSQSYTPGSSIAISAGTLNLNSDAGSTNSATLAVSASGGSILINSPQYLASLTMAGGYSAMLTQGEYLLTHSLSISNSSTLDLTENDLIDDYSGVSPLASIQSALASGYNHGSWNGTGIVSSSAISHPGTALGFAEASDVLGLTGSATGTFDGQTVDATTVLVKFTWLGDTNLDGIVDASDLARISPTGTTWATGDFNYDGVVNADDYALFSLGAALGQANISTITPEPTVLLGLVIPIMLRRRTLQHTPVNPR